MEEMFCTVLSGTVATEHWILAYMTKELDFKFHFILIH